MKEINIHQKFCVQNSATAVEPWFCLEPTISRSYSVSDKLEWRWRKPSRVKGSWTTSKGCLEFNPVVQDALRFLPTLGENRFTVISDSNENVTHSTVLHHDQVVPPREQGRNALDVNNMWCWRSFVLSAVLTRWNGPNRGDSTVRLLWKRLDIYLWMQSANATQKCR